MFVAREREAAGSTDPQWKSWVHRCGSAFQALGSQLRRRRRRRTKLAAEYCQADTVKKMSPPDAPRLTICGGVGCEKYGSGYGGCRTRTLYLADRQAVLVEAHAQLVRQAWAFLKPGRTEAAARCIYINLVQVDPGARRLLNNYLAVDNHVRFLTVLMNNLVLHLRDPYQLEILLLSLGKQGADLGVQPHQYENLKRSIIWSLRSLLGPTLTRKHEAAWVSILDYAGRTMLRGAREDEEEMLVEEGKVEPDVWGRDGSETTEEEDSDDECAAGPGVANAHCKSHRRSSMREAIVRARVVQRLQAARQGTQAYFPRTRTTSASSPTDTDIDTPFPRSTSPPPNLSTHNPTVITTRRTRPLPSSASVPCLRAAAVAKKAARAYLS